MKILQVISTVDPACGGPAHGVVQLSRAMCEADCQSDIVTLDSSKSVLVEDYSIEIHTCGHGSSKFKSNFKFYSWLKAHVKKYDAIIIHGLWEFIGVVSSIIASRYSVPYYVFPHGMLGPWFKTAHPFKHFKKTLYWFALQRNILLNARGVLFTCQEERLLARETFPYYSAREYVVGFGSSRPPKGVSDLKNEFIQQYKVLEGKSFILFLGRVHPVKGIDLLLSAVKACAAQDLYITLVIAGPYSNDYKEELESIVCDSTTNLEVLWTGMLNQRQKWGALAACDVFILPSHHENFGVSVVEALACGKPVLISNKVNLWHEISADESGFVDHDTVDGTQRNLVRWFSLTPDEATSMGIRAFESFERRFSVDKAAVNLISVLEG